MAAGSATTWKYSISAVACRLHLRRGQYAQRADAYGLATSAGDTASVALGGLTLGGGIGWMVRRDGLAIDNLLSAELVTADGRLLRASADEHPDLFWGRPNIAAAGRKVARSVGREPRRPAKKSLLIACRDSQC